MQHMANLAIHRSNVPSCISVHCWLAFCARTPLLSWLSCNHCSGCQAYTSCVYVNSPLAPKLLMQSCQVNHGHSSITVSTNTCASDQQAIQAGEP